MRGLGLFALSTALLCVQASASVPPAEVADTLAPAYKEAQARRLYAIGTRDSLIAAALVAPPAPANVDREEIIDRLATEYSNDPLALYVAALTCHTQKSPCPHPQYRMRLLQLEPDNAINRLLVPSGGALTKQELHIASMAGSADTHLSAMLAIVREALANQDAGEATPVQWRGNRELALMLRRTEIAMVPWPNYTQTLALCNAELALSDRNIESKQDCARLGALLFSDKGKNLATLGVGSSTVRRFARDSALAATAISYRRQYVWISEQRPESPTSEQAELLNAEEIELGEWPAYLRNAQRLGIPLDPPANWIPKRPDLLLLQEERPKP